MTAATVNPQPQGTDINLADATTKILSSAFALAKLKENCSLKEYRKLLKSLGWQQEDKNYLKVAAAFCEFSPEDLAGIEPATLFRLAKNLPKYQPVIEQLQSSSEITQTQVRDLIKKQRKPRAIRPNKSGSCIWRCGPDGVTYCQIPPIHDAKIGTTLQAMIDDEGRTAQYVVSDAIELRKAFLEGRLVWAEATPSESNATEASTSTIEDAPIEDDLTSDPIPEPEIEEEILIQPVENPESVTHFQPETATPINCDRILEAVNLANDLRVCTDWGSILNLTKECSEEVKETAWNSLPHREQQRIYQLRDRYLASLPQVGDRVIWEKLHPHLASWQPFIIVKIQDNMAWLDTYDPPVPLVELTKVS